MGLPLYCNYENIELINYKFCFAKPKAIFIFDKDA
jgi:hypothetical protein